MSRETLEKAVRFAIQNSRTTADLSFFGGEPLLEKDLLWHGIRYAKQWCETLSPAPRLRFFVTSNGTLLDRAFLDRAATEGLVVSLSLDGYGEFHDRTRIDADGHGSFAVIEQHIPDILAVFPRIDVLMTSTPANIGTLAESVERLAERGFRVFHFGPNYEEPWAPEALAELRRQYERIADWYARAFSRTDLLPTISTFDTKIAAHACVQRELCSCCDKHEGEIAIAPSGNIYPCLRFVKEDTDHELLLGTLDQGLDVKKRARIMVQAGQEWDDCRECGHLGRCWHYCSAVNFKVTSSFKRPPAALCLHEQLAIEIADSLARTLFAQNNPAFLRRFYGCTNVRTKCSTLTHTKAKKKEPTDEHR
jgi:uncharacterized protein